MLVLDLADHLLDQILDGRQPVDPAIFVDHQRHVDALALHLPQQDADRHAGRHVKQRAKHRLKLEHLVDGAPEAVAQGKILQVDHAQRLIQRLPIDWQPRKAVVAEHRHQLVECRVRRRRDDLDLGNGHVVDAKAAEIQDTRSVWWRPASRGTRRIVVGLVATERAKQATEETARRGFVACVADLRRTGRFIVGVTRVMLRIRESRLVAHSVPRSKYGSEIPSPERMERSACSMVSASASRS